MKSVLFCSVGRRNTLLKKFKESVNGIRILAADCNPYAPALYFADQQFIVPRIHTAGYVDYILELCKKENVMAVTTLIDPEISVLAEAWDAFKQHNILPLFPKSETAKLCFDKFEMYKYLIRHNIDTILTYDTLEGFMTGLRNGDISFPVFIKPRCGSGSIGACRIDTLAVLREVITYSETPYIIQELIGGDDLGVDAYVDCISNKPVSMFLKKKIETKIGGGAKTISFKDEEAFCFVKQVLEKFEFYGPIDIDLFYVDGRYYLSEINPRFGGGYLHAYGAGVDFYKMILNNIDGKENADSIGHYYEKTIMMMYEDVVIKRPSELAAEPDEFKICETLLNTNEAGVY